MSKYYTNVSVNNGKILYRGINNGRKVSQRVSYSPTLFLSTQKKSKWKTLFNESLEPMRFEGIREARDFVKKYEYVDNFKIYGNTRYEYAFISDNQRGTIDWDLSEITIAIIDIEVYSENGFPDPVLANEPITAIAVNKLNRGTTVYGCNEYKNNDETVTYVQCDNEVDLCKKFVADWQKDYIGS